MFLKIDVEGFEYEVLLGARQLMESGRVAAVMWEKGEAYSTPGGSERMAALVRELGFTDQEAREVVAEVLAKKAS